MRSAQVDGKQVVVEVFTPVNIPVTDSPLRMQIGEVESTLGGFAEGDTRRVAFTFDRGDLARARRRQHLQNLAGNLKRGIDDSHPPMFSEWQTWSVQNPPIGAQIPQLGLQQYSSVPQTRSRQRCPPLAAR